MSSKNPMSAESPKAEPNSGEPRAIIKIALNSVFGLSGNMIAVLLRLAISIIIIRSFGADLYGSYILAMAILEITRMLALIGMENSVVKFVAEFKARDDVPRLRGLIYSSMGLSLCFSLFLGLALFFLGPQIVILFYPIEELVVIIRIMAVSIPFAVATHVCLSILQGLKLVKYRIFVFKILIPLSRLVLVIGTISAGFHIIGIAWSYVLSEASAAIFSFYFLLKIIPGIIHKTSTVFEIKKLLSFSTPLLFSGIFTIIIARTDVLIMGHFLPASMVGIYGIAQRLTPFIAFPLESFNKIFAPIIADLFARKKIVELNAQFKLVTKWIFTVSLPIFTLMTFFSKEILVIMGPKFILGSQAMIILCVSQLANSATGSVGFMLVMTGRPNMNLLNSGIMCIINIILNIILIPMYGITGAACATAISITTVQLLRLGEVWYFLKMHPYRSDFWKPILSSFVSILIIFSAVRLGAEINKISWLILFSIIFLSSYTGLLFLFKLSPEDRLTLNALKDKLLYHK